MGGWLAGWVVGWVGSFFVCWLGGWVIGWVGGLFVGWFVDHNNGTVDFVCSRSNGSRLAIVTCCQENSIYFIDLMQEENIHNLLQYK